MQNKAKAATRIFAIILAVVMLVGIVPTTVFAIDDPITGSTGTGWDDFGGEYFDNGTGDVISDNGDRDDSGSSPTYSDGNDGSASSTDSENEEEKDVVDAEDLEEVDDSTDNLQAEGDYSTQTDVALGASGVEDGALSPAQLFNQQFQTYQEWAESLQNSRTSLMRTGGVTVSTTSITLGGTISWESGAPDDPYFISGTLPKITLDGETAFCFDFNNRMPGGNYTAGGTYSDSALLQILANFEANPSNSSYVAAQVAIWQYLTTGSVNLSKVNWGGSTGSSAASTIFNGNADYSGKMYTLYIGGSQDIIQFTGEQTANPYQLKIIKKNADGTAVISGATFSVTGPNGFNQTGLKTNSSGEIVVGITDTGSYTVTETSPPAGYKLSDPSSQQITVTASNTTDNPASVTFNNEIDDENPPDDDETETETKTETETEVHNSKTYEYSDAVGQITIRKHDQHGNSLDGALFNIRVDFTDGSHILVENWEVDNGARLFTWTHPQDNIDDATVTVTEVQAPLYYDLDPTPKTAVISPTYTRVTHVETWTITITTSTTTITKNGEVIDTQTSEARAESDPQVEEFADFVVGDRETTVTFSNTRQTGDIIVTKRDANTGQPLAGAHIHLWGEDLGDPNHIDKTLITDENGQAVFEFLPPGTYAVQETQPPFGYNLNNEIQNAVLQSNQIIEMEVRNYRKDGLIIKKVDENGKPLPGATFELRRGSGEVLLREVTNENGIIFRDYLVDDTYVIEEISAPEGYLLDESPIQSIRIYETDDNKEYTVTFVNKKKPSIEVTKVDGLDTSIKLAGAVFRITDTRTNHYWDIETGEDGTALLESLEINTTYIVEEIKAPVGYINSGYRQEIVLRECRTHTITVENYENPGIQIIKKDKETGKPLAGATFRISWNNGSDFRDVTTKADGTALVTGLNEGWYSIVETNAPEGYLLNTTPQQILLEGGKTAVVEIFNEAKPSLTIRKVDNVTKTPLQYAKFKIELKTDAGTTLVGEYVSDANGIIRLENIQPGRYLITETEAPDGYNIDSTTHEVTIEYGQAYEIEFTNTPQSPIYIQKVDDKGNPLIGAKFKITTMNGSMVAQVTTGLTGYAIVPYLEPGWYIVEEVQAPDGYILSNNPVNIEVKSGRPAQVEFVNYAKPGLQILKLDADTQEPLIGAKFKVAKASGELVGEYTTDVNGLIYIEDLATGAYVITELRAPDGYILDVTPYTVNLEAGKTFAVEVYNTAKPGLQLIKKDAITGLPVGGARFNVTLLEAGARRDLGSYTTSENGTFFIPGLTPGYYVITETKAADGYILDSTPHEVYVEGGKLNTVEVFNTPYSDLRLLKIDSETREPLEGAVFKLFDEKRLEIGTYTTSSLGEIYISGLPSGTYFLQEQRAPTGYVLNNTVRQIELLGGKTTTVEWKNTPLGSLRIVKIDSESKKPLYGVEFELFTNSGDSLGRFVTDQNGTITFGRNLQAGKYKVKEVSVPEGYALDDTVYTVAVKEGETTEITITNTPLASLRIIKVDADDGDKLNGATFLLYDSKNNLLGEYTTDQNGEIFIENGLPTGKYKLKEIKAPDGYVLDDTLRNIELKNGTTTEIKIENELEVGRIQIVKVSDSKNSITGDKAGDGLKGAVFEIYDEDFELVDKIRTDSRGIATSDDLPLGKYVIKEVEAPKYYFADGKPMYAEIKVHGDLIRFKVENTPEELLVTVEKRGVVETMEGEVIRYTFSNIANQSNCSLDEFFWRDELPTDAVRIQSLNTGTWNERGTYEVWIKTNLKGWKRIKSSLHTNVEYTVSLTPSALGLASNEYVTEYKLEFGTVEEGFTSVKDPFIEVKVNNGLSQGYRFINKTDVGGKRGKEYVYDRDSWIVVLYKPDRKLPKTGGPV